MEEKTPTMPCVVFLKYLKITGKGEDSQGKFEYSECKEVKKETCIEKLKEQVWLLLNDAPPVFQKLGKTLRLWFEPIIRMWRCTKSNGITEGFHRKMKLIQRRGFGYRNFQNYRLRVLVECSHGR